MALPTPLLPLEPLERLQKTVRAGRAVFFIGAGFSLDSESLTTLPQRLIRRLLAMVLMLNEAGVDREWLLGVLRDFAQSFGLSRPERLLASDSGRKSMLLCWTAKRPALAERYYEVNDWFCCTFEALLREMAELWDDEQKRSDAAARLARWDYLVAAETVTTLPLPPRNSLTVDGNRKPLFPLDPALIRLSAETKKKHRHEAGKALFLDTLGFRGPDSLMAGEPLEADPATALRTYGTRLRARHRVLARLARESWTSLLLTTNFDRLLEGGFRMAGFEHTACATPDTPSVPLPEWRTIAGPSDFFAEAGGGRRALMVKLHGCSRRYAELAENLKHHPGDPGFQEYLRSMVFTYREIQNWREDGWSRDLMRNVLRTRTVIFCGYSARDQVIHDTLRGVYEEMAREKRRSPAMAGTAPAKAVPPSEPPVFFTVSRKGMPEFHGLEVLRAAVGAVTGQPPRRDQATGQYLPFHYAGSGFGDPDDLFLWLWHRCAREAQREALNAELARLAGSLLGRRLPQSQIDRVLRAFDVLCRQERDQAETWTDLKTEAVIRREFEATTAWTDTFHPALLREFAVMDAGARQARRGTWEHTMRQFPDYTFPASAQPAWTAWGVVVELALRNLTAARCCGYGRVAPARCQPTRQHPAGRPVVLLTRPGRVPLPTALTIHCPGPARQSAPSPVGAVRDHMVWELPLGLPPWPGAGPNASATAPSPSSRRPSFRAGVPAPDAGLIWGWALGSTAGDPGRWLDPTHP